MFFFFFSSRRRHTRYWRDWSSDVCSSDLGRVAGTSWILFGLIVLQVVLIEVGNAAGLPTLKAFHLVNALAIFGLSGVLAVRSRAYFAAPQRAATIAGTVAGPRAAAG